MSSLKEERAEERRLDLDAAFAAGKNEEFAVTCKYKWDSEGCTRRELCAVKAEIALGRWEAQVECNPGRKLCAGFVGPLMMAMDIWSSAAEDAFAMLASLQVTLFSQLEGRVP